MADAGALGAPQAFNLGVVPNLGPGTGDVLALMRRPNGNPAPLLIFQHAVGSFGRQLCISYELDGEALVCNITPAAGPMVVADINGSVADVPPDEIVTGVASNKLGVLGFVPKLPLDWASVSTRDVPGDPGGPAGFESATIGDLDNDGDRDVLVGQYVNSFSARADRNRRARQRQRSRRRPDTRDRGHPVGARERGDRRRRPDLSAERGLLQRPRRHARHVRLHAQRRVDRERRGHRPVRRRHSAGTGPVLVPGTPTSPATPSIPRDPHVPANSPGMATASTPARACT